MRPASSAWRADDGERKNMVRRRVIMMLSTDGPLPLLGWKLEVRYPIVVGVFELRIALEVQYSSRAKTRIFSISPSMMAITHHLPNDVQS